MKIYYVSDNRMTSNWGCRSTSIALDTYLRKKHTVTGVLWKAVKTETAKLDFLQWDVEAEALQFFQRAPQNQDFQEIISGIELADVLVINGEGDMIFSAQRKTLNFLLVIIEVARSLGKPVYFANAMVSDCPVDGRDPVVFDRCLKALRSCAGVALRDPMSQELLAAVAPDIKTFLAPDALFQWGRILKKHPAGTRTNGNAILPFGYDQWFGRYDFSGDYICLGGTSAAKRLPPAEVTKFYTALIARLLKLKMPLYLVEASQGDTFLRNVSKSLDIPLIPANIPVMQGAEILANARVFVSGRYHPSVMASLGGTPCVCLVSNSHKMPALMRLLRYQKTVEFPLSADKETLRQIIGRTKSMLKAGTPRRRLLARNARRAAASFAKEMDSMLGAAASLTPSSP